MLGWPAFSGNGSSHTWLVPYYQLGGDVVSAERTKATRNNANAIHAIEWLLGVFKAQGGFDAVNRFVSSNNGGPASSPTGWRAISSRGTMCPGATCGPRRRG